AVVERPLARARDRRGPARRAARARVGARPRPGADRGAAAGIGARPRFAAGRAVADCNRPAAAALAPRAAAGVTRAPRKPTADTEATTPVCNLVARIVPPAATAATSPRSSR